MKKIDLLNSREMSPEEYEDSFSDSSFKNDGNNGFWDYESNDYWSNNRNTWQKEWLTMKGIKDETTQEVLNGVGKILGNTKVEFVNVDDNELASFDKTNNKITLNERTICDFKKENDTEFIRGLLVHEIGHCNNTPDVRQVLINAFGKEKLRDINTDFISSVYNILEDSRVNNIMRDESEPIKDAINHTIKETDKLISQDPECVNPDKAFHRLLHNIKPVLIWNKGIHDAIDSLKNRNDISKELVNECIKEKLGLLTDEEQEMKDIEDCAKNFDVNSKDEMYIIDKTIEVVNKLSKYYHDEDKCRENSCEVSRKFDKEQDSPFLEKKSIIIKTCMPPVNKTSKSSIWTNSPSDFYNPDVLLNKKTYCEAIRLGETLAYKLANIIEAKKRVYVQRRNACRINRRKLIKELVNYGKLIDTNVFKDLREKAKGKKHLVQVLIDNSGSMNGYGNNSDERKIKRAMFTGVALHYALKRLGIKHTVRGFQASANGEMIADTIYARNGKDYGMSMEGNYFKTKSEEKGTYFNQNADAGNVDLACKELIKKNGTKLLIVVSDGYPSHTAFGRDKEPSDELIETVSSWQKKGIQTIGIGIPEANQVFIKDVYKTAKFVEDVKDLPSVILDTYKEVFKRLNK